MTKISWGWDIEIVITVQSRIIVVIYFLATEEFIKVATMMQTIVFKHSDKSEELTKFRKKQGIKFLVFY